MGYFRDKSELANNPENLDKFPLIVRRRVYTLFNRMLLSIPSMKLSR